MFGCPSAFALFLSTQGDEHRRVCFLFLRGAEMTRYEWFIRAIADEAVKAGEAKKRGDVEMEKFHRNAATGLHKKLRSLSIDDAAKVVA